MGNDIEYISVEDYKKEKAKNQTLFLFKLCPYTVYKYERGVQIEEFSSLTAAAESIGVRQPRFSSAIETIPLRNYSLRHEGKTIDTPLQCKMIEYKNYGWIILFGSITIIDKEKVQSVCK